MTRLTLVDVRFRLSASSLVFYVDVRLRSFGERWIAVADISGDSELGLGTSAREALAGALSTLGAQATTALLADPRLLAASTDLISVGSRARW